MITYVNKDELKVTMGMATWYELKRRPITYDGLMFDDYYYNIGGEMFSKDCQSAHEAFDKEMVW